MSNRCCVFCGDPPTTGNKEHLIPQWAIRETGDPNRVVDIAYDYQTGKAKSFAFDQLVLPACKACNDRWGKLESRSKHLILELQAGRGLGTQDISTLLDWLDKIRTGLWLAARIHSGSPIEPSFFIDQRVASADRLLSVVRIPGRRGLTAWGCNQLLFLLMPSCFCLQLNELIIFNASTHFLFSKQSGWPYPSRMEWVPGNERKISVDMEPGSERLVPPLLSVPSKDTVLRFLPLEEVSAVYQVVFRPHTPPESVELWDTPWIREHSLDWDTGLGKPIRAGRSEGAFMNDTDVFYAVDSLHPNDITGSLWFLQTLRTQSHLARLSQQWVGDTELLERGVAHNKHAEDLLNYSVLNMT